MHRDTLDIKTVCQCNLCLGGKPLHPQVSLIDLGSQTLKQSAVKFEFYAILLFKERVCGKICCGRKYYDYPYATMVFLTPGEVFRLNDTGTLPPKGQLLAFHPDLLFRTSLKNSIENYTFFRYGEEEALHLSKQETATVSCCLENIQEELHHDIDSHTGTILSRHIELLLDYCSRFYERQFITRDGKNKELTERFRKAATDFIASGRLKEGFPPEATPFAQALGLSTAYFRDLLKFETGKTFEELMQFKRIEAAKQLLSAPHASPTYVSELLGFSSVQYFSTLFKKLTGVAPHEYRLSVN